MKRLLFVAALLPAAVGVFLATSTAAHAGNTLPTECIVPQFPDNAVVSGGNTPGCETVGGLCIIFHTITTGPARAVHPQGAATIPPNGDCSGFPQQCVLEVFPAGPQGPGPARAVHTAARLLPSGYVPGNTFPLDPICFDLPSTGFDVAPVLLAGLSALGAGLAITNLRRRVALRS